MVVHDGDIDPHRAYLERAGTLAATMSNAEVGQWTGLSNSQVKYWRRKVADPLFHNSGHGGFRNWKFTPQVHDLVEAVLHNLMKKFPMETADVYAEKLALYGMPVVPRAWVARVLKRWNYSHQKVYHIQKGKFTSLNVMRMLDHMYAMPHIDPTKLKYPDESRFESRGVRR